MGRRNRNGISEGGNVYVQVKCNSEIMILKLKEKDYC